MFEENQMDFRHEDKYILSEDCLAVLENQIKILLTPDGHGNEGTYTVSSIYFDDLKDTFLSENEAGVDARCKYRIRTYNRNQKQLKLEKKIKLHSRTRKITSEINADECSQLLHSTMRYERSLDEKKMNLFYEMNCKGLLPKVLVEYDRSAYVKWEGNVRITFDRNIRGSMFVHGFPQRFPNMYSVLPANFHVLEVKYDELLPMEIIRILNIGVLQRTSFSKYYAARGGQYNGLS